MSLSRFPPAKAQIIQLGKKYPTLYVKRKFIARFKTALSWNLP